MKKLVGTCFVVLMMSLSGFAQTDEQEYKEGVWDLSGVTGLNFSQTSLENWSAGGENSLAGNAYLNGTLKRKSGNWLWQNSLMLEYGISSMKSQGVRKTNDNIDFSTQLGYSTNSKFFYTGMGSFRTQFYKGYNYPDKSNHISNFMAPAYSNISLGVEWRPRANYSIYYSPASVKMTFVQDDYLSSIGAFGVDPGDRFRAEFGSYLKARAEQGIMKNVNLVSTLDLFTAYNSSFGNIDVNWDVLISMKVNEYLSAMLNTTLRYDDDVKSVRSDGTMGGPKVQFKEVLGVGLAYTF